MSAYDALIELGYDYDYVMGLSPGMASRLYQQALATQVQEGPSPAEQEIQRVIQENERARIEAERIRAEQIEQERIRLEQQRQRELAEQERIRIQREQLLQALPQDLVNAVLAASQGSINDKVNLLVTQRQFLPDAQIRGIVELVLGKQNDSDWSSLTQLANEEQERQRLEEAARQEAERQRLAEEERKTLEKASRAAREAEEKRQQEIAKVPSSLVDQIRNIASRSENEKLDWYNEQLKTISDAELRRLADLIIGKQNDSDWSYLQQKASSRLAEQEAERQRLAAEEATRQRIANENATRIAAEQSQRAAQEARQAAEALQRSTYGMTSDEFRSRLMSGNPSDLLVDQRLLEITLEKTWSPQMAIDMVNATFGTNKTLNDYTTAMSKVLQDPITKLVQNGSSRSEIESIGKKIGIDGTTLNSALDQAIKTKTQEDIVNGIKALAPAGQSINFDAIVKYADDNKLAYFDVAEALKKTFKDTTSEQIVKSMSYEKDRQQIQSIAKDVTENGKTFKSVGLPEAISLAISKGIETENLAKFFGKTTDEFKTLVQNNLGPIATAVRDSGVNAPIGISELLGFKQSDINSAIKKQDFAVGLNKLADANGISFDKALSYASANNVGPYELASYLNVTPDKLIKYQQDKQDFENVQNKLNTLSADGKITANELLGAISEKNMSVEDFVNKYLTGNKQETIDRLKTEQGFTPQERKLREAYGNLSEAPSMDKVIEFQTTNKLSDSDMKRLFNIDEKSLDTYRVTTAMNQYAGEDKQLDYSELAKFAQDNKMDLSKVVSYLGTDKTRPDILKNLEAYVKDEEFKSSLNDVKLKDYKGAQYSANDLLKLANQVKQNFDLKNSYGGVYKTEGQSVGFDYSEAQKLIPEGKTLTAFDQVALDMARQLLQNGITDVSQLSKYKPTDVIETEAQEGGITENVVTKYIDPETGKELPQTFGATYTGEGGTGYSYRIDSSGKPVFNTTSIDTSDKQQIGQIFAVAAAFLAPQLLPELIGTAGVSTAAQAAISAGAVTAAETAALASTLTTGTGLTGALIASGVPASVAGYAATAIVNGVYNGIVAEATGGEFGKGFINGGIAPVIGQLASNAVTSIVSGLPTGVSNAVGNAVTQLIRTGSVDVGQMAIAGLTPTAIRTIVDASGGALSNAQARLLFETVASGAKNITSLADNPAGVVNFVVRNQDVFNNIATSAATGTAQKPAAVDLSGLDSVQKDVITAPPRTETIQGEQLFQDINTTDLGQETASVGIVKPPGEMISTDTSGTLTGADEFAGYDKAIKFAEALASGATQFDGVEAAIKFREALSTGALDYYNYDLAKLEAQLINNQPSLEKAKDAAETLYGKGASFNYGGKFYEGDLGKIVLRDDKGNEFRISKEATLITNSRGGVTGYTLNGKNYDYRGNEIKPAVVAVEAPGSTEVPQARLDNGLYTRQGFQAAGGGKDKIDYERYVYVANDLIAKGYNASGVNPIGFNSEKTRAEDMSTRAGIVRASEAYNQPTQAPLSSYTAAGSPYLAGFGHMAMSVGGAGATLVEGMLRGLNQTEAANRVAQASTDAFFAARNIASTSPDVEKTLAVSSGVLSGVSILLSGGSAWSSAVAPTIVAMNETFRDSQLRGLSDLDNLTRTLGTGAAEYIGEVIGNKVLLGAVKGLPPGNSIVVRDSLVDGYSKLPANPTAQQIKDMVSAWAKINGAEQFSEAVTTALQMSVDKAHGITESIPKTIGELRDLVASQVEIVFGATNIALGIGGGGYAASRAANLGQITIEYADNIAKKPLDTTISDILDATPVTQTVALLTGPDNKTVLNSQGQPILIQAVVNEPSGNVVSIEDGSIPNNFSASLPSESIFDIIFDNEKNGGYTVNSVNLDGNKYTVTDNSGSVQVIDTNNLFNNALNLVTQADPASIQALKESNPLMGFLTEQVAKSVDINASYGDLQTGSIISSNDRGSFAITNDGSIAFVPKTRDSGVATMSDFDVGDSVVIGNGYVAPIKKQVDASGNVQIKVDELKLDPFSGFGRVIGLDDSQALVTLPNRDLLTINRSSLSPDVTIGSTVPYNANTVSQRNISTDYAQSTFGLTQSQLLQGMINPSQLPVLATVVDPSGASKTIDVSKPNIGTGTIISVDPSSGTALVSTATGNPQVVNLQGANPAIGTDLFFTPSTNTIIGTPVTSTPVVQTQPNPELKTPVYTPIGTIVGGPINTQPNIPVNVPINPGGITSIVPPVSVIKTPGADTIPGIDIIPGIDLVQTPGVDTIPGGSPDIPTVGPPTTEIKTGPKITTPRVPFPSLFFPFGEQQTKQLDFGYPEVPPPEIPDYNPLPYPNYLRPLTPYLPMGLEALMEANYAQEPGYGNNKPIEGPEIKIPT